MTVIGKDSIVGSIVVLSVNPRSVNHTGVLVTSAPVAPKPAPYKLPTLMKDWPSEFKRYLDQQHDAIGNSNAADHRPTYTSELESFTKGSMPLYERGRDLIQAASDLQKVRCRRYAQWRIDQRQTYVRLDELLLYRINGYFCIVPRWFCFYEEMIHIQELLK